MLNINVSEAAFISKNVGYLTTPFLDRCRGVYLFGEDATKSITDKTGRGANMILSVGSGGVQYGPDYIDLGVSSSLTTPFQWVQRDMTVVFIGMQGFSEWIYDNGDSTYKWPVTDFPCAPGGAGPRPLAMGSGYYGMIGASTYFNVEGRSLSPVTQYMYPKGALTYPDGTWTIYPQIAILGHGPALQYLYFSDDKGMVYNENAVPWPGALPANTTIKMDGLPNANPVHLVVHAFAAYQYLTPAEALIAGRSLAAQVEARGRPGFSHFAQDDNANTPVDVFWNPT